MDNDDSKRGKYNERYDLNALKKIKLDYGRQGILDDKFTAR